MKQQPNHQGVEVLFVHVPKLSNYYKPLDEFMFINFIPMGIFAMCDILNKKGISSRILHLGVEYINNNRFSVTDYIRDNHVKTVALSLHWHYQAFDVIDVARTIKEKHPDITTVLGGYTASVFADEIIGTHTCIDCVIVGDGEKGITDLADTVAAGNNDWSGVANAVYRDNGAVVNNGVSFTATIADLTKANYANMEYLDNYRCYIDYFNMPYFWSLRSSVRQNLKRKMTKAQSMFPLMIGRGCNFNCSYCGGGRIVQNTICKRGQPILLPVAKVVDIMEQAMRFGYDSFISSFDPFPDDSSYFHALFKEIRDRGISCGFGFESWSVPRADLIREFSTTFIHDKSYIAISPESGSEEVRKVNKSTFYTNKELFTILEVINREKIPALVFLAIGLPGDTAQSIQESVSFSATILKKFRYAKVLTVPTQLEPGSPLYFHPEKYESKTERNSFADFYRYHQRTDSSPYTCLGYATNSITEANGDIAAFNRYVQEQRCRHFCIIQFKLFGKIPVPPVSRFICRILHRRWKKRGFGAPAKERRRFR